MIDLTVGDIVQMRKTHPCGGNLWRVVRVGADVKIRCLQCDRLVMLDRAAFEKRCKGVAQKSGEEEIQHGE